MTARKRKCPPPSKVRYKTRDAAETALRKPFRHVLKAPTRCYWCRARPLAPNHENLTDDPNYQATQSLSVVIGG